MDKLHLILLGIIQSEPNTSIDYQIAHYLLTHIEDLNEISSSKLAEICHVSKASISRFCRRIGLKDFHELKILFNHYIPNQSKFNFTNHSNENDSLKQYIDTIQFHLNSLKENIDWDILDELTEDIHKYKHVIIAGSFQSNSVCLNLQLNLFSSGKITETKIRFSDLVDTIKAADQNSLLIVLSTNGRFFDRLIGHALITLDHDWPRTYLITATAKTNRYPFVYKTLHIHAPADYASGNIQIEIIANLIALHYSHKHQNNTFISLPNSL